jgi:hypothetical protein
MPSDEELNKAADRERERQRAAQAAGDRRDQLVADAERAAGEHSAELDRLAGRIAEAAAAIGAQTGEKRIGLLRRRRVRSPAQYTAPAPGSQEHGRLREVKFTARGIEQVVFHENDSWGRYTTPLEELNHRSRRPGAVPRDAESDFETRQARLALEIRGALESFMGRNDIRL